VLVTGLISAGIVLVAFAPVYARYGTGFFNFYAEHGIPGPAELAARMTLEVWGLVGFLGICTALASCFLHVTTPRRAVSSRHLLAWAAMLVIYAIAFFCLPDEAAYLIPAVPFTMLLLWRFAPRWVFQACCGLIVVSPFITWRGGGPAPGLIIQDHRERMATDAQINGFLRFSSMVSGSNAYIVGSWEPPIAVLTADVPRANAKFLYLVSQAELDQLIAQGWHVWYLPLMREFDARVYGFDVEAHGARDARLLRGNQTIK
jgi:hypothetical protein